MHRTITRRVIVHGRAFYLIELVFSEHSKKNTVQCRDLKLHVGCKLPIPPQCRTRLGHLKLMLFLGLQASKVSAFAKWRRKASLLIKIHDHGISPVSRTIAQTRNTACVLTELENESNFGVSSYTIGKSYLAI